MKYRDILTSSYFKDHDQITIYKGDFRIEAKNKSYELNGEIFMSFYPTLALKLKGSTNEFNDLVKQEDLKLAVPEMLPTEVDLTSSQNFTEIEGDVYPHLKNAESNQMNRYLLHVANFINYVGEPIKSTERYFKGGVYFEHKGWSIDIQKREDSKELFDRLKKNRGYSVTHIIEVKRLDGEMFDVADASQIVETLLWTMSFSAGRHISIPIEVGLVDNEIVYKNFQKHITSPNIDVKNWFPKHKGEAIKELFIQMDSIFDGGFIERVLKETIHQYIESIETRFLENKLVLSQAVLEKMSYVLLTQKSPQIISNRKFKKNSFRDNLELVLSKIGIEIELINEYTVFGKDFKSGPHLIAQYRNHILHPKPNQKFDGYNFDELYSILNLSMYYTELLILYLLEYNGLYSNRLNFPSWEGTYERLPWNSESDADN